MSRVLEGKNSKRRVAAAARSAEVAARRPILVGILLTVVLLTLFAIESRPSGAATTANVTRSSVTTPAVSPVTVTVPGQTAPAPTVTAPPVTTPTPTPAAPPATAPAVVTPPATSAPSHSTSAAPSAPAPSVPRASTSAASGGSSAAHARRVPRGGGSARLRSVVVRLSSCVSRLKPRGQRLLLLRAGIGIAGSASRRAVARKLRISVAREARSERAALRKLRTAARRGSCGRTPAWIHVPAANRLVLVDPALTVSADPVTDQRTKVSLTLTAAAAGSRLISGPEWRRLVLMPAQS